MMPHESAAIGRRCAELIGLQDADQIFFAAATILTDLCGIHLGWISQSTDGGIVVHTAVGNRTQCARGVVIRAGLGLGGKVYDSGRALYVNDYVTSDAITHDYDRVVTPEGIGRAIAAPIVAGGRTYGVLFGGYRDAGECGSRAMAIVEGVAQRCGEAVLFTERLRAATDLAVREDRRRTADAVRARVDSTLDGALVKIRELAHHVAASDPLSNLLLECERETRAANARLLQELDDVSAAAPPESPAKSKKKLSAREFEVLARVAIGETNDEIATAMSLTRNTVKAYLRTVMTKLGARNRVETVVSAKAAGIL